MYASSQEKTLPYGKKKYRAAILIRLMALLGAVSMAGNS